jgi:methionyl aminopeptidase
MYAQAIPEQACGRLLLNGIRSLTEKAINPNIMNGSSNRQGAEENMNSIERNQTCWCGSGLKYKKCHAEFDGKLRSFEAKGITVPPRSIIKTPEQIQFIRESGKVNTAILDHVSRHITAGMTTEDINTLVYDKTVELGGRPAQLHFEGFPKSVCTSINNQVCHGIPSAGVVLEDGDIINVDVSTHYNGYYSDSSRMFTIGEVKEEHRRLVETAKECMEMGLQQVEPWQRIGNVGAAINEHARKNGYSVVIEAGGHGIGLEFHEEPWVGYVTRRDTGMLMVPGMIFTVEPMVNMGSRKVFTDENDGWTIYTSDGKPSAQWETMVLVTETGHEVLAW